MTARSHDALWVTLLRVGSVRFSALYFAPFYAAVAIAGHGGAQWIVAGSALCVAMCLATEYLNRYVDRREDVFSNPRRTAMCERVGFTRLLWSAVAIFGALVPVGILWLWELGNMQLFVFQGCVWLIALNYSWGLRLKTHRVAALFALGATLWLPFMAGWLMYRDFRELPASLLPMALLVCSIAGAKDLTDEEGDRRVGYHSLFLSLTRRRGIALFLLLLSPYMLLTLLVVTKLAPARMLGLCAFVPASLALGLASRAAGSDEERVGVREWTYHFWMLSLLAGLWLLHPSPDLAGVMLATGCFWLVASRCCHWIVGPTLAQGRSVTRALGRSLAPQESA